MFNIYIFRQSVHNFPVMLLQIWTKQENRRTKKKVHEVNSLKSLKLFGILHWWILAAYCEIKTKYLNLNQVIMDGS